MIVEDEILVIKEIPYKDNDKILHALSRTRGKVQVIARGCRKNTSRLVNIAQIFAHSQCTLFKSRDMYIIDSAELIDSFYGIRKSIDAFMYGSYVLELLAYVSQENETDERIFDMTVKFMACLSEPRSTYDGLMCAYELKLVSMLGYRPELRLCMSCGEPIKADAVFSLEEGGFCCQDCRRYVKAGGINMEYSEILTMDKIMKSRFKDVDNVTGITPNVMTVVRKFLFSSIGRDKFAALGMLHPLHR